MKSSANDVINGIIHNGTDLNGTQLGEISDKLEDIVLFIQQELKAKQQIIDQQQEDIKRLTAEKESKEIVINSFKEQLENCSQQVESNRQLINKLLGDISHYQNDIEWYKRTYEKRSLFGVIKNKLIGEEPPQKK
jgi:chromosome segregation ATPase